LATDATILALETHRIREDNIMIVQGERLMEKMVYLRFALETNYLLCPASAPIFYIEIQIYFVLRKLMQWFLWFKTFFKDP
jgi:hypothetical protein